MKKILLVLMILILTGCKSELICTLKTTENNYESETKNVFEFNGDKIINSYSINIMTFENEDDLKMYLDMFKNLDDSYEVKQISDSKLEIKVSRDISEYKKEKTSIKEEYEKDGYSCK